MAMGYRRLDLRIYRVRSVCVVVILRYRTMIPTASVLPGLDCVSIKDRVNGVTAAWPNVHSLSENISRT